MSQHAQDGTVTNPLPKRARLALDARTACRASPRNPPNSSRIVLALVLFACIISPLLAVPLAQSDAGNAQTHYNAAPPAFGAGGDTTVPAGVELRSVYGSLTLSPTALSAANVTISICGGVVLENFNVPQISGATETLSYAFTVTGGDCYRFNNNLDPSVANRISAYNYVDVLNESFESQTHANATWESQPHANATAATECPLTDCVNNSWYNRTAPFGDVRVSSADHRFGRAWIQYDPSPYVGLGATIYARPSSSDSFTSVGDASQGQFYIPRPVTTRVIPCPIAAEAYIQAPSGEVTPTVGILIPCDYQYQHNVTYVEATSQGANVTVTWQSDATSLDSTCVPGPSCSGGFEVFGGSTPDDTTQWNGVWWPWEFQPDWYCGSAPDPTNALCLTGTTRSITGPLSDFVNPTGTTYLSVHLQGNGETGGYDITSCVLAFVADGSPHSCGTLAPAASPGNVTTFLNQTFVNATAGGGIQFVPFAWGDAFSGAGQRSIILGVTSQNAAETLAGIQIGVPSDTGTTIITQPFGVTNRNANGEVDGGATMMLREGALTALTVRAMGPYNTVTTPVVASADADATLAIQLQENGVDVPGAVATWTAGEDAVKDIPLPDGSLPFLATDAFSLELTLTSADAANDAANLYNALMGIAWNGTGNATFVNQTVFVNASGETFLPVLFGESNQNAGMGDTFFGGPAPRLDFTGTILGAGSPAVISPFPEALAVQATEDNNVFMMTRNGTFLSADIRAIGPYEDLGCCTDSIAVPSTENVSLLIEVQKNNVTLGSETWTAGEVATKTITLSGGGFVEGDNFRLVLTPSNTAPANATYFNLVEATYGILWAGNATSGGNSTVTSMITVSTAFDQWIPLLIWGGLLVLFIWLLAWAPALGALMALANAIFPHPLWSTAASVLLVAVLLIIHALATRGILPLPWGKKE